MQSAENKTEMKNFIVAGPKEESFEMENQMSLLIILSFAEMSRLSRSKTKIFESEF